MVCIFRKHLVDVVVVHLWRLGVGDLNQSLQELFIKVRDVPQSSKLFDVVDTIGFVQDGLEVIVDFHVLEELDDMLLHENVPVLGDAIMVESKIWIQHYQDLLFLSF